MELASNEERDDFLGEMYALVLHWLRGSECKEASEAMEKEVDRLGLLPVRVDYLGNRSRVTHEEWRITHPNVMRNHLERMLRSLLDGQTMEADRNTCLVPTLLSRKLVVRKTGSIRIEMMHRRYCYPLGKIPLWTYVEQRELGGIGPCTMRMQSGMRDQKNVDARLQVQSMQYVRTFRGHRSAVYCVVCDFKNRFVITGADDRLVKIWSRTTGYLQRTCRGHQGDITDLAVSADSELLVSASNDCTVRVWRLDGGLLGECVSIHKEHLKPITSVRFSVHPMSLHTIFSASEDGTCKAWDPFRAQSSIATLHPAPPSSSAAMADPSINPGAVRSAAPPQFPGPPSTSTVQMLHCAFNKKGNLFAVGCSDFTARVWSYTPSSSKGKGVLELPVCFQICELRGHCNDVVFVEFSQKGDKIATASKDGSAKLWYPAQMEMNVRQARWQCVHTLKCPIDEEQLQRCRRARRAPQSPAVNNCCWNLDDSLFLAAAADKRIYVWDTRTGRLKFCMQGHKEQVYVIMSHPLDPRLAMTAGYDGQILIWDVVSGIPVKLFCRSNSTPDAWPEPLMVVDAQFTPDGGSIVASDNTGQFSIFSSGGSDLYSGAQYDQFFARDYAPLVWDLEGNVIDAENQQAPDHTAGKEDLVNFLGEPYPEPYQSFFKNGNVRHLSAALDEGFTAVFLSQPPPEVIPWPSTPQQVVSQSPARHRNFGAETNPSEWQGPQSAQAFRGMPPSQQLVRRPNFVNAGNMGETQRTTHQVLLSDESEDVSSESGDTDEEDYEEESSSEDEISEVLEDEEPRVSTRKRRRTIKYEEETTSDSEYESSEDEESPPKKARLPSRIQRSSTPSRKSHTSGQGNGSMKTLEGKGSKKSRGSTRRVNHAMFDIPARSVHQYIWLLQATRNSAIYVPQFGDQVYYIPQGHKVWLETIRDRKSRKPWEAAGRGAQGRYKMKSAELCKVKRMDYVFCSDGSLNTTVAMSLEIVGEDSELKGWTFELELPHPSNDQPDFLVDPARFNESLEQLWRIGSRCKVLWLQEDGTSTWYNATIMELCPEDLDWLNSPYLRYKLLYDADFTSGVSTRSGHAQELYRHSLWELYKIQEHDDEPHEEGIGDDIKEEIKGALHEVFSEEQYEIFFELVPAEASWLDPPTGKYLAYNMVVHLPIALSIVSERIDNAYYRSVDAVKHDLVQIVKNSCMYNGTDSKLTRTAKEMVEKICRLAPSLQGAEPDMNA